MIEFPEQFNMASYFLDQNLEAGRGGRVCLRYRDQEFTYAEVAAESNRAGNVLRELGVDVEDRVLMVLPDVPEFAAVWFGIAKIGAVITMVNTILSAREYRYYLNYTRARAAVVHETALAEFMPASEGSPYLRGILVAGNIPAADRRYRSYRELSARASDRLETAPTHRDDIAIWLFTSGSTGEPKAAVHLHHDLPYNTECFAKQVLQLREEDITLSVPKLFFGYATGTNLLFPWAVGARTALFDERSTPEKLFEMIEQYRPTILTSVPTMISAMARFPDAHRRDLSSLRLCLSAGEALPAELYRRWMDTFGVEILDGIGSAELFHIYISNRIGDVKPGSLGRRVPGYDAKILDPAGSPVNPGESGTLWVRGDSAAICYWNDHSKSKQVFHADWVMTGDQFREDKEGYFWYEGRTDEMLKVAGKWVSPAEVENCLLQHSAVADCAVVGWKDLDQLIKPKAYVVVRPVQAAGDELGEALRHHVKQGLGSHKAPRWIEFVDHLPKNERGKVDRKRLKSQG